MIFENAYGEWIKTQLNQRIQSIQSDAVVKLSQDVNYNPLYSNPNTIVLIVNGGNASRSAVQGINQNVMPLSLMLLCREEYKLAVRNAMDNLQEEFNAVPMELNYLDNVTGDEYVVNTKSIFNTPMVLDERDHPTKKETIKITVLQMTASVIYGKNAYIHPLKFLIDISGIQYPITHIADYNMASSPAQDEFQTQGNQYIQRNDLAQCSTFSFTIYRVSNDSLQEVFENELLCSEGGLRGEAISLCVRVEYGVYYIPITKYSLVESYVNNASAYTLTLGR